MNRRSFIAAGSAAALVAKSSAADAEKWRVAVIGHTGRGNYGHGIDTVWKSIPETQIVAVADADAAGLEKAKARLAVARGFRDYRTMLAEVEADIVAVCPRHIDQHAEMALAAVAAGAVGVYVEKPFCRSPAEADQILAACKKHGAKLAVAHRNRYHPTLPVIDKLIADGGIGKVLEIRGRGKGDRRGGAEDLWVLGSHVLDLVHHFGGAPKNCSASVLQDGRPVVRADVKDGPEGLGPLAGNELHARFEMEKGFTAHFDSIANDGTGNHGFGLQIIGSKAIIHIRADRDPLAHLIPGNPFEPTGKARPWLPITSAGVNKPETRQAEIDDVVHHVTACRDLIDGIRTDRQPRCGAREGAMTVEMICAVFDSHRQGGAAVPIPLKERRNALGLL